MFIILFRRMSRSAVAKTAELPRIIVDQESNTQYEKEENQINKKIAKSLWFNTRLIIYYYYRNFIITFLPYYLEA